MGAGKLKVHHQLFASGFEGVLPSDAPAESVLPHFLIARAFLFGQPRSVQLRNLLGQSGPAAQRLWKFPAFWVDLLGRATPVHDPVKTSGLCVLIVLNLDEALVLSNGQSLSQVKGAGLFLQPPSSFVLTLAVKALLLRALGRRTPEALTAIGAAPQRVRHAHANRAARL
eukprot:CAMPEP_0180647296 /NCGR_PEP_ID=MMETSP1037_2-20121125/50230_1 /TAXON_ID=632150 /ORGANISM="Azadinium spinosum, Strain 3D9" /LENGTH=169 /DNA_ID=CAMNT_0022671777 /DNA_START=266 /DNA_END=773 /DNA_ORIENTATION=+